MPRAKFTVRLTRRELITIESMLRMEDDILLNAIAEGFNEEIEGTGIRRLVPLTAQEALRLADRLHDIEGRDDP